MSEGGVERSLSTRIKCRMFGHDWLHRRERGERQCLRCYITEDYSVSETHEDENAEKGAMRYRIEDDTLYIERYQVSAWGDNSEYWQWHPLSTGPAGEEDLIQLKQEIEQSLSARTEASNDG